MTGKTQTTTSKAATQNLNEIVSNDKIKIIREFQKKCWEIYHSFGGDFEQRNLIFNELQKLHLEDELDQIQ